MVEDAVNHRNLALCFPKLFCWLADHMENATIHGISNNRSPICVTPADELGEYLPTSYPTGSLSHSKVSRDETGRGTGLGYALWMTRRMTKEEEDRRLSCCLEKVAVWARAMEYIPHGRER